MFNVKHRLGLMTIRCCTARVEGDRPRQPWACPATTVPWVAGQADSVRSACTRRFGRAEPNRLASAAAVVGEARSRPLRSLPESWVRAKGAITVAGQSPSPTGLTSRQLDGPWDLFHVKRWERERTLLTRCQCRPRQLTPSRDNITPPSAVRAPRWIAVPERVREKHGGRRG